MFATNIKKTISIKRLLPLGLLALATSATHAAAPGISGTGAPGTFILTAQPARLTQPDGQSIYSWGYGCVDGTTATFLPKAITSGFCSTMQVPGPTLIVTEGTVVNVTLNNNLPAAAGNTSILFPGFTLTSVCPSNQQGLLTCEAPP